MKLGNWGWAAAAIVLAGSLIALSLLELALPWRLALGVLAAGAAWLLVRAGRKRSGHEIDVGTLLQMLSQLRHDWLNDLQVLYGYMRLNKRDKVESFMENLKLKLMQESKLSKLGDDRLVFRLLALRLPRYPFKLDVTVEQEIRLDRLPLNAAHAANWIGEAAERVASCALEPDERENRLSIEFESSEDSLFVDIVYIGNFAADQLTQELERLAKKGIRLRAEVEQRMDERSASVSLTLPFIR